MQLNEELTSTENKVSFARQAFNDAVTTFNTQREVFLNNIFADKFGFKEADLFEVKDEVVKEAPKVGLLRLKAGYFLNQAHPNLEP